MSSHGGSRLRAAVLGATGVAGQEFLTALADHPLFELVRIGASERSAGKRYREAICDASGKQSWFAAGTLAPHLGELVVEDAAQMSADGLDVVFTAVESDAARQLEPRFAAQVPVFSTASAFRYESDVPILIPGVNLAQAQLLRTQQQRRGWRGFVVPGPNCTTTGLAITLAPLVAAFGVERVMMTSLQSVSGAGRSPGVIGLDILDNVIPYIAKEEEKVETETRKILGALPAGAQEISPADLQLSCTCTRVAVLEGHTEAVFVGLGRSASVDEVKQAMRAYDGGLAALGVPSAPRHLITVSDDPYRPQPRLDRENEGGMTTTVGRVRLEPVLGGVKYVLVSHNTRMGAAKGAILTAECLLRLGYYG